MKIFTKKLILILGILAILFAFKTTAVNADAALDAALHAMCITSHPTVTVTNNYLPQGENVWVSCSGDYGPLYGPAVETQSGPYGTCQASCGKNSNPTCKVCIKTDASGNCTAYNDSYSGGVYWCSGDIQSAAIGSQMLLKTCSCANPSDHGCLKVTVSANPPTMNTCVKGENPTVVASNDSNCTTTVTNDTLCGQNKHDIYPHINVTCTPPVVWTPYCTGADDPKHPWEWWDKDNSNPINYRPDPTHPVDGCVAPPPTCKPATCSSAQVCGDIPSGCNDGKTVHCGDCTLPYACDQNTNTCTCTKKTTCDTGQVCGQIPDGCGGFVTCQPNDCNTANTGQVCNGNTCGCPAGQLSTHFACTSDHVCTKVNTCGVDSCNRESDTIKEGKNCVSTSLSFVIGLDGIGTTGDQLNPGFDVVRNTANDVVAVGSTANPVHETRPIAVLLTDSSQKTTQYDGNILYDSTSTSATYGKFTGSIDLGNTIQTGDYSVIASVGAHLKKSLGTIHITVGQNNPITGTPKNLAAGDITGDVPKGTGDADNHLDGLDYNVLMSCSIYTQDNHALCYTHPQFFALSDLEDNGDATTNRGPQVDQFDYNLFLRELSANANGDNPPGTVVQAQASLDLTNNDGTIQPTATPTVTPTIDQTAEPTATLTPTVTPTIDQTAEPTATLTPTVTPTIAPTAEITQPIIAEPTATTAPQPTGGQ
jgi:hypothetical protein